MTAGVKRCPATHLEGVQEAHPVADLVDHRIAQVVAVVGAVRERPGMQDAPVLVAGVIPRQSRNPTQAPARVRALG